MIGAARENGGPLSEPRVWAVVTHWNNAPDSSECVSSVLASDYANLFVVIVDNGSDDGSEQLLAARFPAVPLLQTGQNGAVTAAYNRGIDYALQQGADYVLMLNNDTTVASALVRCLVQAAVAEPRRGVVTPKIYYYSRPDTIWFAGARRHRWDFGAYDSGVDQPDKPAGEEGKVVDYAWACGMLLSRPLLERIGLFDTRFWLYYDDVDICLRAQQAGFQIWYEPRAAMWHKVGASTGSARFARTWAKSKMLLFRKHARGPHRLSLIGYAYGHAFYRALFPTPYGGVKGYLGPFLQGLWAGLTWREPEGGTTPQVAPRRDEA